MDTLVLIPTYNERQNIGQLLKCLVNIRAPRTDILVIDDSSPDGTSQEVAILMKKFPNIHLLLRERPMGLGTAYIAGMKWAINRGYKVVAQMDGDLSHDPKHLEEITNKTSNCHFVIGSRYLQGGRIENWSITRKLISRLGNSYAKLLLGNHVSDWTGGYNAWNIEVLKAIQVEQVSSEGYCFQIEIKYKAICSNFSFIEVPIVFRDRVGGKSKLSKKVIIEAAAHVPKLRMQKDGCF